METLFIVGSSYLLPSHKAWINLKTSYAETKFYEYGDFISAIEDTPPDAPLALVIFFQDLFPVYAIDSRSIESAVDSLIELLQRRLHDASAETLICYADQDIQSPISSARTTPSRTVAYERFREAVDQIVQTSSTAYKLDLGSIFAKIGEDLVYDTRNWYLAHSRLSSEGIAKLVETIQEVCTRIKMPAKKILVLDCDNTLWGGVVGEDGLSGIKLGQDGIGQAFVDFQRAVKQFAAQGTLLAVCSKNNEADVMSVFEQHHAMVLKKEDIVAWKVNWDPKSDNIQQIAQELDLGLDSFVFWDDNPLERDLVREGLPKVEVPELPRSVTEWPTYFRRQTHFSKFATTSEDKTKLEQYRSRAKFVSELKSSDNRISYLKSIGLKPEIQRIGSSNIGRAAQLCAKTNQFNLRTVRHTEKQLEDLSKANPELNFLVSLADNYGNHGIIGLVCSKPLDGKYLFLDTFLMSCRVLGRHLESWMLYQLTTRAKIHGYDYLVGQHIPSERNQMVAQFLQQHAFTESDLMTDKLKVTEEAKALISTAPVLYFDLHQNDVPNLDIFEPDSSPLNP